jgi:hypothetical protein
MATATDQPAESLAVRPWGKDSVLGSKSDQYLARRFAAASAEYKSTAVVTFLLGLAVAALAWLLTGVLVEHWLVPGGLPGWARWAWLAIGLVGLVAAGIRWLVPLLRYRINIVYAARAIERSHPELHNDLVNAVLVRERSGDAAEAVVKSLRRRAARQLSAVPGEEAVADRRSVARLSWAFAVLASGVILYQLLAPKSLLTSAARIVAPWTGVSPPARVWIEPPRLSWRQPGEAADVVNRDQRLIPVIDGVAEIVRGRQLVVETEIDGLAEGEKPTLLVTPRAERTGGEAIPGWQVPLAAAAGQWRRCVLPDDDRGLDYPVDLVIKAGDARSGPLRVAVVDAPSLLVREVRYEYPAYMRRESETLPWQGDIRGVEGTRVTIVAQANRPLHSAGIDLGSDGRRDVALTISGKDRTIGEGSFGRSDRRARVPDRGDS